MFIFFTSAFFCFRYTYGLKDLGNLIPDASGTATFDYTLQLDTSLIVGRGIIVHAGEDDGMGASGNAGARVAQCVLGRTDF